MMNTTTTTAENFVLDNFTAVDFLTNENRTILLDNISWADYEMFLGDFEKRPGWRAARLRRRKIGNYAANI